MPKQDNQLEKILAVLPSAVAAYDKDENFIYCNNKFCELFGYSLAELKDKKLDEINAIFSLTEEDTAFCRNLIKDKVITSSQTKTIKKKDGSFIAVRLKYFLTTDLAGETDYLLLSFHEVKRDQGNTFHFAADSYQGSLLNQQFIQFVNFLELGFLIFVPNTREIVFANHYAKSLFGLETNLKIGEVPPNDLLAPVMRAIDNNINKAHFEEEIELCHNNLTRYFLLDGYNFFDFHNRAVFFLLLKDITIIKERQLLKFQQEKINVFMQISTGLAHELRNPLTTIKGFAEMINRHIENEQAKLYLKYLNSDIEQIDRVLGKFLKLAYPEETKMDLMNVNDLLLKVLEKMNGMLQTAGVKLELDLREVLPVFLDGIQIKRVFKNLIENAVQSMQDSEIKLLHIETEFSGDSIEIKISDTGKGIPNELIEKIGTPFFTTQSDRVGLGLSYCYKVIKAHNGIMKIQSIPGDGTRVVISLPSKYIKLL